jgi:virginiamycin B lyase
VSVSTRTASGRGGRCWGFLRSNGPRRRGLLALLTGVLATLALPAAAAAIDEFPLAPGSSNPGSITRGPDGALWFTLEAGDGAVGRMTTGGVHTNTWPLAACSSGSCSSSVPPVDQIVLGPDNNLWFTLPRSNGIGRMNAAGAMISPPNGYPLPTPDSQPEGLTVGPPGDGRLWFTEAGLGGIGWIDMAGQVGDTVIGSSSGPSDIAVGPDGALWFTESLANAVGRITTGGVVTNHFPVPTASSDASGITNTGGGLWFTESAIGQIASITTGGVITEYAGAGDQPSAITAAQPPLGDGALWFTESGPLSNAIGRITTGGVITNHFPVPTPASEPSDITQGPDGNLWFTEFLANKIGRVVTAPPAPPPPLPPVVSLTPKAKPKPKCKVPKLRGLTIKKAKKKLKKARCKYKIRGKGRVVSTKPKAGKRTSKTVKVKASRKLRR